MIIYEFSYIDNKGIEIPLSAYKDQVLLIVNTASKCAFTPQYKELQELYMQFKDKGFVIIGFPCDQFANQEFSTNEEIKDFCQVNFGVTFPLAQKVIVKGTNIHPLFQYLVGKAPGLFTKDIKWNFTKFLIDSKGKVIKRYAPTTGFKKISKTIQKLLN